LGEGELPVDRIKDLYCGGLSHARDFPPQYSTRQLPQLSDFMQTPQRASCCTDSFLTPGRETELLEKRNFCPDVASLRLCVRPPVLTTTGSGRDVVSSRDEIHHLPGDDFSGIMVVIFGICGICGICGPNPHPFQYMFFCGCQQ